VKREEKGKKTAFFKELTRPISEPLQIYTNITNKDSLPKTEKSTAQALKPLPVIESQITAITKCQPSSTSTNTSNEINKEIPKVEPIDLMNKKIEEGVSLDANEPSENDDDEEEGEKSDDQDSEKSQEESQITAVYFICLI
jgi:hypothetical protein